MPRLELLERPGRRDVYVAYWGSKQKSMRTSEIAEARERYAKWLLSFSEGASPTPREQVTVRGMVEEFRRLPTEIARADAKHWHRALEAKLLRFWGDLTLAEITPANCRRYHATRRKMKGPGPISPSTVRNELSLLQRIANGWCDRQGIAIRPNVELPAKDRPRVRWLEPREVAALICAARGRTWDRARNDWRRRPDGKLLLRDAESQAFYRPFVRLILLGVYTGSRSDTMLRAGWTAEPHRGHIDLEDEIFYRKGAREAVSNKRGPPARLCPQLLRHAARWAAADAANRYGLVVHDGRGGSCKGLAVDRFAKLRALAGLGRDVSLHVLRHTCATWLLEGGATLEAAAAFLGLTIEQLEKTYAQCDPAFTAEAADALNEWGRPRRPGRASGAEGTRRSHRPVADGRAGSER